MANRGAAGVLLRTNKKGRRSAPTGPYTCTTCKKQIEASGLSEFTGHTNACKLQADAARREAERRAAALRGENN
ncbi:hypothetical protein CMV_019962 [Castanea mollissima]|uniref:Uncharacterized protein n=1 Tax=Castanea mollissima TaxID=60419 RepID=A0A8J4QX53_9ROSI|nr:hypothetical protein CMV_019962 [Castanea mollissima]